MISHQTSLSTQVWGPLRCECSLQTSAATSASLFPPGLGREGTGSFLPDSPWVLCCPWQLAPGDMQQAHRAHQAQRRAQWAESERSDSGADRSEGCVGS